MEMIEAPDDAWLDEHVLKLFSHALSEKLADSRAKGRHGWQNCGPETLWQLLREHVDKGDPRDVACLAMMVWYLIAGDVG